MYHLPLYVWALVLIGATGIPVVTCMVLYQGAIAADLGPRTAARVASVFGVGWAAWTLVSGLLADSGAFRQDPVAAAPWFGLAFVGALAVPLLCTRIPVVAKILAAPGTPARLALPQVLRGFGSVFLVVLALGDLPAVFSLPAGFGDLLVGVSAPSIARRLRDGTAGRGAVWFNIMGLVDLVVAVGVGVLAGLGPTRVLFVTPSTAAITLLPLVLIPVTAVPLAAALHLVSLAKLRAAGRTSTDLGPSAALVSGSAGQPAPSRG